MIKWHVVGMSSMPDVWLFKSESDRHLRSLYASLVIKMPSYLSDDIALMSSVHVALVNTT